MRNLLFYIYLLPVAMFMLLASNLASASPQGINVPSAHASSTSEAQQAVNDRPFLFSFQAFTDDPRITLDNPDLGYLAWLTYYVNSNLYVRVTGTYFKKNKYGLSYLMGYGRAQGVVRPYAEMQYTQIFQKNANGRGLITYDSGLSFVFNKHVIPVIELDNFLNTRTIGVSPQLVFPFDKRFSILVGMSYVLKTKNSEGYLRFSYSF